MKDRTRQLSQDLIVIKQMPSKYSIGCLEQTVRYVIVAAHDGVSIPEFDMVPNLEQMTKSLGTLTGEQYRLVRNSKVLSPTE